MIVTVVATMMSLLIFIHHALFGYLISLCQNKECEFGYTLRGPLADLKGFVGLLKDF